jgi:crotonobetainyl-CoA:carnitine CoA-transferase CaiB-like acyl-CoA transferase
MSDFGSPERLPLDDVRVLAVEQYGAGPWATLQLAELGAEVIKIEDPRAGGDVGRYVPPFQEGEDSLFFETFNGGKKSISLDLATDAGRAVFVRLVESSDVVFSNLRGDGPAKLGLRYADLAPHNPSIVCCSLSGFGTTGPRAASGALDYVIQGIAGWMSLTGEPDSQPTRAGLSLVDFSGGSTAALAIMGGVHRARRDGVGCDCDISLQETALSLLTYLGTWVASRDYEPVRRPLSAHPSIVPFQNFATADGWIVVACPKQTLWERLCNAIGRPELIDDADFADFAARDANRARLVETLSAAFRTRTTADWLVVLSEAGVPNGPVNDIAAALSDEQVVARDGVESYVHERLGAVRRVRSALRLSGPRAEARPAPERGADTRALVDELFGAAGNDYERLEAAGAFGDREALLT